MDKTKQRRLRADGWKIGSADEFLGLNSLESAYLDLKIALARGVKVRRCEQHLTQMQLARLIQSSQSRVAKMEACDPSVTVDLLIRALLALGASPRELGRLLQQPRQVAA